ncbi:hypothetical protein OAO71_01025, partial [Planctomycetota bacterium]|nr:hypothetical protein [Planctomycetota bacterium]
SRSLEIRPKYRSDPQITSEPQPTTTMRILPASLLPALFLAACSSAPELSASVDTGSEPLTAEVEPASTSVDVIEETAAGEADATGGQTYTIVATSLINPDMVPAPEEMLAISSEHEAFVEWLQVNASLAAAGPVVPPRGDSRVRQLMFFNTPDVDAALERCCEGPASGTGLYENGASSFVTHTDLSRIGELVLSGSGDAPRPYVIITGPSSTAMTATVAKMGSIVLCQGDCTDGALAGRCVAIIDCVDVEDARLFMGEVSSNAEDFSYHSWIGPVAFSMNR